MTYLKISGLAALCFGVLAVPAAADAPTVSAGMALFKQRCAICHTTDPSKKSTVGPNLAGVLGRKAASRPDFRYSTALKNSKITWSQSSIAQFLSGPGKMVPGSSMPMAVPGAADRSAIVAYLATLR